MSKPIDKEGEILLRAYMEINKTYVVDDGSVDDPVDFSIMGYANQKIDFTFKDFCDMYYTGRTYDSFFPFSRDEKYYRDDKMLNDLKESYGLFNIFNWLKKNILNKSYIIPKYIGVDIE